MDKSTALANFIALTATPSSVAEAMLERNDWDVEAALDDFYSSGTHREATPETSSSSSATGQSTSTQKKPKAQSKFKSFSQLVNEEAEDDDEKNYYAGGGRGSALNVENPNDPRNQPRNLVQDLLRKAETGEGHPDRGSPDEEEEVARQQFNGVGYQLGNSTDVPSRTFGAPATSTRHEKVTRQITFWKDGFQVGDGKLYRYDDPKNAGYLSELNAGRAPLALLDVKMGQDVDVGVLKKIDEEYKPPKRKLGGFEGSGHRLGSPVSPDYIPPTPQETTSTPQAKAEEPKEEEEPNGDTQVQIRLADGRRLVRRIMSTAPVQELFDYVASETSTSRQWTLNHAFPVKPVDADSTIKEAGLANSVVVQRWA